MKRRERTLCFTDMPMDKFYDDGTIRADNSIQRGLNLIAMPFIFQTSRRLEKEYLSRMRRIDGTTPQLAHTKLREDLPLFLMSAAIMGSVEAGITYFASGTDIKTLARVGEIALYTNGLSFMYESLRYFIGDNK